jgi:hypothetical protein
MAALAAAAALAVFSTPLYWSAPHASAAFPSSAWAHSHHARDASCSGAGAHIHAADGTPLYRYFICFADLPGGKPLIPGGKPVNVRGVWMRAAVT